MATKDFVQNLRDQFLAGGFEFTQPFCIQDYNKIGQSKLPTFNRDSTLGVLIGNTKTLWPAFSKYVIENEEEVLNSDHPLDMFVEATVNSILANVNVPYKLRWSTDVGDKFVHLQSLAQISGLAYFNTSCYLCTHKVYGPWIALRTVICFDMEFDIARIPQYVNPFPEGDKVLKERTDLIWKAGSVSHDSAGIKSVWEQLVEIRDYAASFLSDPLTVRYPEEMIRYHYTRDKSILRNIIERNQ
ncbi:hypothetical protein HK098_001937 [Nowakowskiella sp. JEL0407]|nr:hypothetical protein HK098_001937 [Nowakowskiella sp. JEL0407]